jgi:hypothetical protein
MATKRHYLSDQQTGLVLSVHTTSANAHDGQCMAACLDQVEATCRQPAVSRQGVLFSQKRTTITAKRFTEWYPTQGPSEWAIVCVGKAL